MWTLAVQTHTVQGSTVKSFMWLLANILTHTVVDLTLALDKTNYHEHLFSPSRSYLSTRMCFMIGTRFEGGKGSGTPFQYSCLENPWTEEPGGLQSMGSWRVGHNWATSLSLFTIIHWRRKWQPTPVFLPGESQGWQSLVGCCLWGRTELDTTEAT